VTRTAGLGAELPRAIAQRHGIGDVLARAVVHDVLDAVAADADRMVQALASGDPDLHLAARVVAQRLRYAMERVLRQQLP
jgi:CHAD domain-containing protein